MLRVYFYGVWAWLGGAAARLPSLVCKSENVCSQTLYFQSLVGVPGLWRLFGWRANVAKALSKKPAFQLCGWFASEALCLRNIAFCDAGLYVALVGWRGSCAYGCRVLFSFQGFGALGCRWHSNCCDKFGVTSLFGAWAKFVGGRGNGRDDLIFGDACLECWPRQLRVWMLRVLLLTLAHPFTCSLTQSFTQPCSRSPFISSFLPSVLPYFISFV